MTTTTESVTKSAIENQHAWDQQIASLLGELSAVQEDLLALLSQKRELIAKRDIPMLSAMQPEEKRLTQRLAECHANRQAMLAAASEQGLPGDSVKSLAAALPKTQRLRVTGDIESTRQRARLLQHQSLTNWVLVQRSLLHLSQMIEIIATGGKQRPTYGDSATANVGGALVDRAV